MENLNTASIAGSESKEGKKNEEICIWVVTVEGVQERREGGRSAAGGWSLPDEVKQCPKTISSRSELVYCLYFYEKN